MRRMLIGICGLILFFTGCSKNSSASSVKETEQLVVYCETLYSESSLKLDGMGMNPAAPESWRGEYLGVTSAKLFSGSKKGTSNSAWSDEDYLKSKTIPSTVAGMEVYALKGLPSSQFLILYGRDEPPVLFQEDQVFFFSGDTCIAPYKNLIFAEIHDNGQVLCMDGSQLSVNFPTIAAELPQWEWSGQLYACLPSDVSGQSFHVYDTDYDEIFKTGRAEELEAFCREATGEAYYVSVEVTRDGRQMKRKKNYVRSGCEYVFRMNKP